MGFLSAVFISVNVSQLTWSNLMKKCCIFVLGLFFVCAHSAHAEQVGSVDTVFKLFGPDHKIVVEAFDDPDIKNVTCYISRAKTGGIKGGLGLAEDTSDAAISCQQVGPIELSDKIKQGKDKGTVVFQKRTSLVFKKLQVVRFYDDKRNALIYLSYSDKVVDGSPKNALSAVPIIPWGAR
jgi:CreA protein